MNKRPYITPPGYFDSLKMRLGEIPEREIVSRERSGRWSRFTPYLALVGVFAVAIIAGRLFLHSPSPVLDDDGSVTWETLHYADLSPFTDPDAIFDDTEVATSETSEDDIINYLIDTGTSLEWIAQNLY